MRGALALPVAFPFAAPALPFTVAATLPVALPFAVAPLALVFYVLLLVAVIWYVNTSVYEHFGGIVVTTANPVGQCFECTAFYSSILASADATKVVENVKTLNVLIDSLFAALDTFMAQKKTICKNVATIADYIDCITLYVTKAACPAGFTPADCVLRSSLLSTVISKSTQCSGGKTCTQVADFEKNLIANIALLKDDYQQCKTNFAATDTVCVQQYGNAITTRVNSENIAAGQTVNDGITLVSRAELAKKMYDMSTYATTAGYKG